MVVVVAMAAAEVATSRAATVVAEAKVTVEAKATAEEATGLLRFPNRRPDTTDIFCRRGGGGGGYGQQGGFQGGQGTSSLRLPGLHQLLTTCTEGGYQQQPNGGGYAQQQGGGWQ